MVRNLCNLYYHDHDESSEEVCKCDSYNTTFSPEEHFKPLKELCHGISQSGSKIRGRKCRCGL